MRKILIALLLLQGLFVNAGFTQKWDDITLKLGADFRARFLKENNRKLNSEEYTNDREWQRYRLRLWTRVSFGDNVDFNLRLATEPRYYSYPDYDDPWVRNEVLFDRLNLTFHETFGLPVKTILGRQTIRLRESWLVGEGTPLDGTRTDYFDAIRTIWDLNAGKTKLEVMWIENRRNSSAHISPIHDINFDNIEQDERGAVIDLSHEIQTDRFINSYFIYKKDHNPGPRSAAVEGETYTFGIGSSGKINDNLSFNLELAPQFGHKNGKSLSSFATNSWLQWLVDSDADATVRVGYEFLSGDSDIDKHFDKLWGREGLWSDLYTGGVDGFDGRELDSSNLHRPYIKGTVKLASSVRTTAEYSLLFAHKKVNLPDESKVDNDSSFRGHHLKAAIEHDISDNIKHYITAQFMVPGEYYSEDRQDTAMWFRYGIEFVW